MNKWEIALNSYIKATNSHQFENVKQYLSTNAKYYFSDKICTNLEAIQSYFEDAWNTIENEVYSINNVEWTITDNMAYCLYYYRYKGIYNNAFVTGDGKATNIFILEKGKVKLIHEHLSSR